MKFRMGSIKSWRDTCTIENRRAGLWAADMTQEGTAGGWVGEEAGAPGSCHARGAHTGDLQ